MVSLIYLSEEKVVCAVTIPDVYTVVLADMTTQVWLVLLSGAHLRPDDRLTILIEIIVELSLVIAVIDMIAIKRGVKNLHRYPL